MSEQKSKTDIPHNLTHDTFFKEMFQMPQLAVAFLKKFLPQKTLEWLDFENLTIETKDFVDDFYRKTRPDMVYEMPIIGEEGKASVHVIIEHKSYDDCETIFQIWKYVHQLCLQDVESRLEDAETKKRKPWSKSFRISPIIPIIFHHGAIPFTGEVELRELFYPLPGAEDFLPNQKAILVDLSKMKAEEIPRDANVPELHIVLLIMKTISDKDDGRLGQKLDEILEELRPFSEIPMYGKLIRDFWFYAMNNVEKLEKTDVENLEIKIREITGDKTMPSIAQQYIQEGKAEMLLRILTRRFRTVPKTLEKRVYTITDPERFDQLADFAFDCETLEDFTDAVR